jgi:hypothetical protein
MAKVGWTVQSAFYDRNSHAVRESVPSLCREAAQSNKPDPANPAMTLELHTKSQWRRVADLER